MIRGIRAGSVVFAAAVTAAMVGLSVGPATAATSLTVKVSNGGSYIAKASRTVLSDNGVSVFCTSTSTTKASVGSGKIPTGTHRGVSPVKVGTAAKLAFHNCSGPLGKVTTMITKLPYKVSVDSKTTRTGKTDGIISGVNVKVTMTGCSFTVTGSSPGFYINGKHLLVMTTRSKLPTRPLNSARLTVSNVVGCAQLVSNGDHPTFVSTYTVSRKIVIKSR
jgi:hypothetical protein